MISDLASVPAITAEVGIDRRALKPCSAEGIQVTPFNSTGSKPRYIVKDQTGAHYISTNQVGLALLKRLDGQHTLEEIRSLISKDGKLDVSLQQIERFADLCQSNNLLVPASWTEPATSPNYQLGKRGGIYKRLLKGERLLDWLMRRKVWWFNPLTALFVLYLMTLGVLFVLFPPQNTGLTAPLNQISGRTSDLYLALLPLIFLLEVSLHELAHGLSCRLFGARAGGFGFGLLWGVIPMFFTDTTDAYTIDNKYKRMLISAAGPMVDLTFLGLCALLAWNAPADSALMLIVLAYSSFPLSALLINLNPFLIRMDGYWILADWLEQPNLRRFSFRYLRSLLYTLIGRPEVEDAHLLSERLAGHGRLRIIYILYSTIAFIWTVSFVGFFAISMIYSIIRLLHL